MNATVLLVAFAIGILIGRGLRKRRKLKLEGGEIMFIVKADNPDVGYTITPPSVTDSEGNPVSVGDLTFEVSSDNPGAVALTPDPADQLHGSAHFGSPNADGSPAMANINVAVKATATGTLLGSFGAQFTVTTGDPAAIVGGSITFEGLTEV